MGRGLWVVGVIQISQGKSELPPRPTNWLPRNGYKLWVVGCGSWVVGCGGRGGNRARRRSGFPTFISCQRQDAHVLPKRRQSHQGDKLCDVSTVPLVARWPVFFGPRISRGRRTPFRYPQESNEVQIKKNCSLTRWDVPLNFWNFTTN